MSYFDLPLEQRIAQLKSELDAPEGSDSELHKRKLLDYLGGVDFSKFELPSLKRMAALVSELRSIEALGLPEVRASKTKAEG